MGEDSSMGLPRTRGDEPKGFDYLFGLNESAPHTRG